jgi:15-cis-phytoene synthase
LTVEEAYLQCRAVARREARNFYFGFILLDRPRRDAIHAAYAFSRRCDDSVDGDEPMEWKLAQLIARRQEIAACAAGRPDPDDGVLVALADAIARYGIPVESLAAIVDGVEMDLTTTRYTDFEGLKRYCDRVAGAVGIVSLHIFGFTDQRAPGRAEDLGVALQIVNIMRDVAEDAGRGRIYLPTDDMEQHGVSEADIVAAQMTPGLRELLAQQGARARSFFAEGRQLLPLLDRRSRMCVATMSGLYVEILDEIEARDFDVFSQRVGLSTGRKVRVMVGGAISGLSAR